MLKGIFLFFFLVVLLLTPASRAADVSVALVIGNAAYTNVPRLKNPIRDAEAVASTLARIPSFAGRVSIVRNADKSTLEAALANFQVRAKEADVALIYYSGHGVSIAGTNYLIPVDASLPTEDSVPFRAVSLNLVVTAASQAKKFKLILLDACRNNPFADKWASKKGIARKKGLVRTPIDDDDFIIGFATKEGSEADDGDGTQSPYSTALVKHLPSRVDVREMLRRVNADVREATNKDQKPDFNDQSGKAVYIAGAPVPTAPRPPVPTGGGNSAPVNPEQQEIEAWRSLGQNPSAEELEAFLQEFPKGKFARIAGAKLKKIKKPVASLPPAKPETGVTSEPPPKKPAVQPTTQPPPRPPTPVQSESPAASSDENFIFPDSDRRYISSEELARLSARQLEIARNELFARYGYRFSKQEWQDYFGQKSWYRPQGAVGDQQRVFAQFNQFEKENLTRIQAREKQLKNGD